MLQISFHKQYDHENTQSLHKNKLKLAIQFSSVQK